MESQKTIFVWLEQVEEPPTTPVRPSQCPWCTTTVQLGGGIDGRKRSCPLCAWYEDSVIGAPTEFAFIVWESVLKGFDINSTQVALEELGTHIKQNYSDIYSLSWRKFESLVSNVFRMHGYETVLTQATRDDGADIIVLANKASEATSIIECKKYREDRKIGVAAIRALVGAAVDWEVRKAYFVTTSDFSSIAKLKSAEYKSKGYDVDLVAASDLLNLFQVYNRELPPLNELTEKKREEIIRDNISKT